MVITGHGPKYLLSQRLEIAHGGHEGNDEILELEPKIFRTYHLSSYSSLLHVDNEYQQERSFSYHPEPCGQRQID